MVAGPPQRRRIWACLLLANVALAAVTTYYGRRFHIDEVWYKAAGLHLATEGRFAAPEEAGAMPGRVESDVVFASQPPVYPLLFAGVVRAFGFGPDQVVGYDAGVRVGLSLAAYGLLSAVAGRGGWGLAGVTLVPWAVGTSGRPDELAMAFGAVAVWMAVRGRVVGAGVLLGLTGATSVGGGVTSAIAVAAVLWPERWRASGVAFAVAAAVAGAIVAPVWVGHPGSIDQFVANGRDATGTVDFAGKWVRAFRLVNTAGPLVLGLTAASVTLAFVPGRHRRLAVAAAVAFTFVFARLPGKYNYLWMAAPVAAAAVAGWATDGGPRGRRRAVTVALLALVAVGSALPARDGLLAVLCPAELRPRAAVARLRRLVPDGAVVLCDEAWPMLGERCRVVDTYFVQRSELPAVGYALVSGNASAAVGRPRSVGAAAAAELRDHFALVDDGLARWPPRVLGVRIAHASYGYGFNVYRRTSAATPGRN